MGYAEASPTLRIRLGLFATSYRYGHSVGCVIGEYLEGGAVL
ncbi:MAG: hypothetical protein ACLQDF_00340 [Desulfomonilia bacterium]